MSIARYRADGSYVEGSFQEIADRPIRSMTLAGNQLFMLDSPVIGQRIGGYRYLAIVGETSSEETDFGADSVGVYGGVFTMGASGADRTALLALGAGDTLTLTAPDTADNVTLTLSGSPTAGRGTVIRWCR